MALSRREMLVLGAAGVLALAMPAYLLSMPFYLPTSDRSSVGTTWLDVPLVASPAAPPPLTAAFSRKLFGGADAPTGEMPDAAGDAPQLVGVVGRIGSDAVAMVRSGDSSRTLQVGESVDGWTLESLAIDAAFFTRGGQRVRVPLPAG